MWNVEHPPGGGCALKWPSLAGGLRFTSLKCSPWGLGGWDRMRRRGPWLWNQEKGGFYTVTLLWASHEPVSPCIDMGTEIMVNVGCVGGPVTVWPREAAGKPLLHANYMLRLRHVSDLGLLLTLNLQTAPPLAREEKVPGVGEGRFLQDSGNRPFEVKKPKGFLGALKLFHVDKS